jgi:hypothetical protein
MEIASTSSNYDLSPPTRFEFPIEVWRIILSYLDYTAIRFATVSKIWKDKLVFSSVNIMMSLGFSLMKDSKD